MDDLVGLIYKCPRNLFKGDDLNFIYKFSILLCWTLMSEKILDCNFMMQFHDFLQVLIKILDDNIFNFMRWDFHMYHLF